MPPIDFAGVFILFALLVLSLTVHEAAHAWSADRLGDSTARLLGRVSLNPAVHVDPIGTILFPLVAIVSGIPLIGWAKPVPVNTRQLGAGWKEKFMLIAAAGPASNLAIAVAAAVLLRLAPAGGDGMLGAPSTAVGVLLQVIQLNVLLALFNMLPVPPLDGGNVLAGLLRGRAADAFDSLRPYGFIILYVLMLSGVLGRVIQPIGGTVLGWLL